MFDIGLYHMFDIGLYNENILKIFLTGIKIT